MPPAGNASPNDRSDPADQFKINPESDQTAENVGVKPYPSCSTDTLSRKPGKVNEIARRMGMAPGSGKAAYHFE